MVSDRLPCVRVGDKYEPIDSTTLSTDAILALLVSVGGSRYVDELLDRPAHWTTGVEGLGTVDVHAIMRADRVQARFTMGSRSSGRLRIASPAPEVTPGLSNETMASALAQPALRSAGQPHVRARSPAQLPVNAGGDPREWGRGDGVVSLGRASDAPPFSLDQCLAVARDAGASDLHVVASRPLLLRIAGELVPRGNPVPAVDVERVFTPTSARLRATLAERGSCDFAIEHPPYGRFRVNVASQRSGLKACLRCIPQSVPTLASLGLPAEIERATRHHQGLVLVTGPTGHGKTSTLAAIVDIINRETTHHVITVEEPIEYLHARKSAMISQREVGTHTRSFATALKASLREDPDVIVVGELRDTETVRMALAASETGHLVIGTMNTPSAAKTIDRMIDLFPPADQQQVRMTLAGGLHLVVGQRLVPSCDGRGLCAAVELLTGSVSLWSLIRDNKTFQIPSLQQRGKGFGILRLDESLVDLVRAGRITRETALAYAESPDDLATAVGVRPPGPPVEALKKPDPGSLIGVAGQILGRRKG